MEALTFKTEEIIKIAYGISGFSIRRYSLDKLDMVSPFLHSFKIPALFGSWTSHFKIAVNIYIIHSDVKQALRLSAKTHEGTLSVAVKQQGSVNKKKELKNDFIDIDDSLLPQNTWSPFL